MSAYKTAGYTIYWKFPTATERMALAASLPEIGKVALQEDSQTYWILIGIGPNWYPLNSLHYMKAFHGEVIPAGHQRLVYGDYEILGDLVLEGELVIL